MEDRRPLADRINHLFATIKPDDTTNRSRSNGAFFNEEIAQRINGPLAARIQAVTGAPVKISHTYIGELRSGKATDPRLSHLVAIAIAFDVPLSVLADDDSRADRIDICLAGLRLVHERGLLRRALRQLVEQAGLSPTSGELLDHAYLHLLALEGLQGPASASHSS